MKKYIIVIIAIIILNYTCNSIGKKYYNNRIYKNKTNPKVYDMLYTLLPNYIGYKNIQLFADYFVVSMILYTMYHLNNNDLNIFMKRMLIILFIRGVTINLTILPRDKECNHDNYSYYNLITGQCYDKLFSGHFALGLLSTLSLNSIGVISNTQMYIYNIINSIFILIKRSHYTNDIIFAFFVTMFVYNEF